MTTVIRAADLVMFFGHVGVPEGLDRSVESGRRLACVPGGGTPVADPVRRTAAARGGMVITALTRTGALTWLAIRRDRAALAVWIVLIALLGLGTTSYYLGLFATEAARAAFAWDAANTPALLAFAGELYGTSRDAMSTWRMRDLSWTLIALMTVLTVIRHTRAEEESGRQELICAAVVGRYAPLTAALLTGCLAGVAAAGLTGLGLVVLGLDSLGCVVFAVIGSVTGAVFAGVAAVAAQLARTGRGALGLGVLTLGASYLLRFVADGGGLSWLKWFTPLGWAHLVRPFEANLWVVPLFAVLVAAVLAAVAYLLVARRDFGAGLLPARPGSADARHLGSPIMLAWRLHRGLLVGWVAGFAVAGLFLGALVAGISGSSAAVAGSVPLQLFEVLGPIAGIDFWFVEVVIPYWHLPRILAGGQFTAVPLLGLTVIAGVVVAAA